jgi:hypothetical protein
MPKEKSLKFLKAMSIVNGMNNVENYLCKILELEFIKYLIFDNDQLSSMRLIKENVKISDSEEYNLLNSIENFQINSANKVSDFVEKEVLKNAYQSLAKIESNDKKTEIDLKLLNFLS